MFKCPFNGKYCSGDYMGSDGLCDADTLPIWEYQEKVCKEARQKAKKPKIICLCGSTKFIDMHAIMKWKLEKEGAIVLSMTLLPFNYPGVQSDHQAEFEGVKEKLDELHLRKIDLADEVFIINKGSYIGESTQREIEYAKKLSKPINYLEKK